MRGRDLTPMERGLLVGWWLAQSANLGSTEVARRLGVSRFTAWRLLRRAERVLPVVTETQPRRDRTE